MGVKGSRGDKIKKAHGGLVCVHSCSSLAIYVAR